MKESTPESTVLTGVTDGAQTGAETTGPGGGTVSSAGAGFDHAEEMGTGTSTGSWYAICETGHGDSGWSGPIRSVRREAEDDVKAHNAANPGHGAYVYG